MNAPDLTQLPPPEVVETLDFETILQVHRADLLARYPEAAAVIDLESEPLNKLLQAHAYRELLYRQRVNEALANLQARGLIDVEYGGLRVPDVQALRTWCCQPHGANSSK